MIRFEQRPSGRHFLQIPGPTNVPDRVLRAIDHPTIDHRGPEFGALGRKVLPSIKTVFKTGQAVVIYPASGTGAWEAALVNTLSPGDRVLMSETGHFASLWQRAGRAARPSRSSSSPATGATASIRPPIEARLRRGPAPRDQGGHAWCTTRPRPASPAASVPSGRRSMRPGIRRCSWSTRSPRSPRSTTATTNGASTSPWPARRRA